MSVRIVNAPSNPDNPVILYDNKVSGSTVTASTEATGFDADNTKNALTWNFWKPTTMPATIEYDNAAFTPADACGIAAHNLGTQGCGVTVQYWDGSAYQDIDTFYPVDDSAILFLFTRQTATKYRLSIVGDAAPSIGVVYFGNRMEMTRRVYGGHQPVIFGETTTIRPNRSEGGNWLGRSLIRTGAEVNIDFNNIEASWMRENYKEFVNGVVTNPFFISWRPTSYPQEIVYCWTSSDIRASNTGQAALMQTGISAQAYDPKINYLSPHLLSPFFWYKSNYLHTVTKDTSDLVSQWDDISGNGYDLTATSTAQPTWTDAQLNSQPTIVFNGTANTMTMPSGVYTLPNGDNTTFIVCKTDTNNSTQLPICMSETTSTRYDFRYTSTANRVAFQSSSVANFVINHDMDGIDTDYNMFTMYRNGSLQALSDNGGEYSNNSFGNNEPDVNAAYVGSLNGTNFYLDGAIAEIIAFPEKLSDDNIVFIEKYLANEWGFNRNAR